MNVQLDSYLNQINTKEEFQAYEDVRISGVTNMFDVRTVTMLSGLDWDTILVIMKEYEILCKKYPEVRTLK